MTAKSFVAESPTPADLKDAGLDKPAARVTLTVGKSEITVLLGVHGEAKAARWYAALGSGDRCSKLSSDWVLGKVRVAPDDLRDLHVAVFDRAQVGTLALDKGDAKLAFTRTPGDAGETWEMTAPEKQKAQGATLAGMVYRLWSTKAKHVAVEKAGPKDLEKAGLDKPAAVVELKKADGTALARLVFGKVEGDSQYVTGDGVRIDQVIRVWRRSCR